MGWDFSTDPEFEASLRWMRGFVRDEVFPLETLDLPHHTFLRAIRPRQEEVKARGLWVDVPSEHVPTRRQAARQRFADLLEDATQL